MNCWLWPDSKNQFSDEREWFRPMYVLQIIWRRQAGEQSSIYAMAAIDPGLYEASRIDGRAAFGNVAYYASFDSKRDRRFVDFENRRRAGTCSNIFISS